MALSKTNKGLPNSCSKCGKACVKVWYAANEDMARSGQGFCWQHSGFQKNLKNAKTPKVTDSTATAKTS